MSRQVVALTLVTGLLAACSTTATSSPAVSASASVPENAIEIAVSDFMLDRADLEVTGPTVTLVVTNDGPTPHNVAVRTQDDELIVTTADLTRGQTETITAELEPGEYITFCSLPGHESLGIKGTLTVTAP